MGQQQTAFYLRLSGPGVRDVQWQQVFLPENRRYHVRHPRCRESPALSRVRIMLGGFIAANFCAFPAVFISIAAGVAVDGFFYVLKDRFLKAYRKKGKT